MRRAAADEPLQPVQHPLARRPGLLHPLQGTGHDGVLEDPRLRRAAPFSAAGLGLDSELTARPRACAAPSTAPSHCPGPGTPRPPGGATARVPTRSS
ncbi:hypothetical protein SCOCK_210090 [Actinacidiphila cocklensis]|uniref:Uncharacterized protein n=1 Tax=Actinacidiphila cocklensis TaxID=887465 RepID=A0A9W4DLK3_9ACTN|nr:hypothetical protein SCOCK_210090 [Actinacidiphila cocklensis]